MTSGLAPLLRLLATSDPDEADSLRSTLAELMWNEPDTCRAALLPLLDDPALRVEALWALGHVVRPDDIPLLTRALSSEDPAIRRAAVDSLPALTADPRVEDLLVAALSDPDMWTRHHAVLGLAWDAPAAVVDHLIPLATDESWQVRAALGEALGRLSAAAAAAAAAQAASADALAAGSDRRAAAAEALLVLLGDAEPSVRAGAARGLGNLGDARDALIPCAADPDERVRAAVAVALATSDGPESVETLRALAADESSEVRWNLAAALGPCQWPEAGELRTQLAADPSPVVRQAATS
ncbi:HEAT repeat domain-containing protein [Actinoplanes sp. CA-142083]|uniref:HEAT repeat domain-containing protein n=1 Tax=Actinoplanes sp. CA-142083 TaxID=3239903 RepID=UPI003D8DDC3D